MRQSSLDKLAELLLQDATGLAWYRSAPAARYAADAAAEKLKPLITQEMQRVHQAQEQSRADGITPATLPGDKAPEVIRKEVSHAGH